MSVGLFPDRLLVFSRYPLAGQAKTRLIPLLGPEGAAELQQAMTRHMLGWARDLARQTGVKPEIHFSGGDAAAMQAMFGKDFVCIPQSSGDLGQRLETACSAAFSAGARRVLMAGTDCPALTSRRMARALEALATHDVVLIPATDGGYVLIGLSRDCPQLFRGPDWGTDRVLQQTLRTAATLGLSVWCDEALADIDLPADLLVWDRLRIEAAPPVDSGRLELSIVIPALNEAGHLPRLLADLNRQQQIACEIIVVDGGSTDATAEKARSGGAACLSSSPGRGLQMNCGAAAARAPYLLFLHADTRLIDPMLLRQAVNHLQTEIMNRGSDSVAGHFGLTFEAEEDSDRFIYRYLSAKTRLNRPGTVHGDQGLMIGREYFRQLGGFETSLPFLEDARLAQRIDRTGSWVLFSGLLVTSARRFESEGFAGRYFLMGVMMAMHDAGAAEFFLRAPEIYRQQSQTARLSLWPFFRLMYCLMHEWGIGKTLRIWRGIGSFLRCNLWQLCFLVDCLVWGPEPPHLLLDRHDRLGPVRPNRPAFDAVLGMGSLIFFMGILAPCSWLDQKNTSDDA